MCFEHCVKLRSVRNDEHLENDDSCYQKGGAGGNKIGFMYG